MSATASDWDAATYDRVSEPQVAWAQGVLDRLRLRGDETVLDAGCGSGRVTRMLLERLPRGRAIAVDAAPSMAEHARAALGERATVLCQDLTALDLGEQVDAVFSNAVFHWILDHDALFARLHDALRPGGRLVAQCGGAGNVARFYAIAAEVARDERFAARLGALETPYRFAGVEETEASLRRAGLEPERVWLEPAPVTPPDVPAYLATVCLRAHVELLPDQVGAAYVDEVTARLGEPAVLDYVRLNIDARRPG